MNLSVKDAARLLSVSEKTIYRWIKQEVVPAYKVHESYRFNRAELLEWATSRRMGISPEAYAEPEVVSLPLPSLTEALEAGGVFYRIEGLPGKSWPRPASARASPFPTPEIPSFCMSPARPSRSASWRTRSISMPWTDVR
jgi:excisionase family DNA binding protein